MDQPQGTQRSQKAVTRIDSAFAIFAISAISAVKHFHAAWSPARGAWKSVIK
jgi:hypothetical protein